MADSDIEELRDLVKKNLELTQETHHIVRSMRRSARWSWFFTIVWWLVIIAVSGAAYYYYLQPYVDQARNLYSQFNQSNEQAQTFGKQFSDFLKQFSQQPQP